MKLFQQLLVAPAALGLLAPIAANATDLNIKAVSDYSSPKSQKVTSFSSFSDIQPSDWTYKALTNLAHTRGCSASISKGSMTRYEAASLLNSCLDNIVKATEEEKRLIKELRPELEVIKGRMANGNESEDMGALANVFSTTTKVSGIANFIIGGSRYEDVACATCDEAAHTVYSWQTNVLTSFSGEDALKMSIDASNMDYGTRLTSRNSDIGRNNDNYNTLEISKLYYTRPLGDFQVAAGPLFEMDALVATTTSTYSNDGLFYGFYMGPNFWANHPKDRNPGGSISYINDNGFNAGLSMISVGGSDSSKGLFTEESFDMYTLSAGYDGENWGTGIIYTSYEDPTAIIRDADITTSTLGDPTIIGLGAYWNINDRADISIGVDMVDLDYSSYDEVAIWAIGIDYEVGPGTLSAGWATVPGWDTDGDQNDIGTGYEVYYNYPVSDNISVKPMIMVGDYRSEYVDETIFAVETTFKF